jgi:hypothetical protein
MVKIRPYGFDRADRLIGTGLTARSIHLRSVQAVLPPTQCRPGGTYVDDRCIY